MCLCFGGEFAFDGAVLGEVERLVMHCVVLANVSVLGSSQEGLDALRVVAKGKEEVALGSIGLWWGVGH